MRMLEGGCFVTDLHADAGTAHGTLRVRPLMGRHNGTVDISMRSLEFEPGESPWLRAQDWDDVWYVLRGNGGLWLNDARFSIGPDTGIHVAPGARVRIDNRADETLRIISVRCPDPGTDPHMESPRRERAALDGTGDGQAPSIPADASVPPMPPPLVHLMDCEAEQTADRWYRVLVDPRLGCQQVTQFVGSIPPGRAPDHFHDYEEVLCILEGHGRIWTGGTHTPIAEGSCVYLPRRQVHCVENRGDGALRLLGVFYPAGSPADRHDGAAQ